MGTEFERQLELSKIALADPQPGDHWHEMYSWHMFVLDVTDGIVTSIHASPPCSFPKDGKIEKRSIDAFRKWLSYGSIDGTWAHCLERNHNINGWSIAPPIL
jgi:hypothetical protein